jgi:hypothetical protein
LGLPKDTSWGGIINSETKMDISENVELILPNGTYTFEVIAPEGYIAHPAKGIVTVINADTNQQITFTRNYESPWQIDLTTILVIILLVAIIAVLLFYRKKKFGNSSWLLTISLAITHV